MKTQLKLCLIFFTLFNSVSGYSRGEFPFCPAGGPPGWMNYFDYKRDQNILRRQQDYQRVHYYPYYFRPVYSPGLYPSQQYSPAPSFAGR
jgi:hypothetical protein